MRGLSEAWGIAIADWCLFARCMGEAESSLTTRRQQLGRRGRTIGVECPWSVTPAQLVAWFGSQEWANETRRSRRTTYRVFYAWGVEQGLLDRSPALALPRVRPSTPNPMPVPDQAYRAALLAADERERLILRMGAEVGMRRAEVAQAHSRDLVEDLTGWSIVAHGKGGRDRLLPLPDSLAAALRCLGPGYFFPGRDHGHLSARWVGKLMTRLLPEPYTMHKLRHRFASRAYAVEKDIVVVQELLGHASPATTRVYIAVGRDRLRATVEAAA